VTLLLATASLEGADLELNTRLRERDPRDTNLWRVVERTVSWDPRQTAIVVCDMWDRHWCSGATGRVAEMAPRMNDVLKNARSRGVFIIHCPSDTMGFYEGTPQRTRAQTAPRPERRPEGWRSLDPSREPPLPIDDSDGGCDDWPQCRQHKAWTRQIATLEIAENDAITDSDEAYNLMMARGITNVIVMGVHLNMCVLGRPFSIRQMVLYGQNVVLMRDMTDTMYNSRMPPHVSHFAGTDLVTEHVEKYWCPSITSVAFLGGEPFRFREDRRPRVAIVIGEDEYQTWETLPEFAETELRWRGFEPRIILADKENEHSFPSLISGIRDADLVLVSVRRRALPREQLDAIRAHVEAGKPLVGIRTASHAFAPRGNDAGRGAAWPEFDRDVLGGNYHGHHPSGQKVAIEIAPGAGGHPVLKGVRLEGFLSAGSLYRVRPLAGGARPLLVGSIPGEESEPVAWTHESGEEKARVFYTSLGHPSDFQHPSFRRMLLNAIVWGLGREVPGTSAPSAAASQDAAEERLQPGTPALSPEESAARFTVADGLEMELILSEPVIAQPLQISFDERGRLWLVEYRQYPAPAGLEMLSHDQFWRAVYDRVPAAPPNHVRGLDRISIHEDSDRNGEYDRHTVFVDGLNIATAAARGRGGVWVLNPPYLLFYPDRDNDDVPDGDPEVHLEGFGLEDTHSVVNSLCWGPDGWLYAAQGSTVSARVQRPGIKGEPQRTLGQNIWRYHPETRRYEVFAEGGGNAFGVEIDEAGRIFSGHNGGNTRGFHYVQGGYLQKGFEKHGELSNPYAFGYYPPMKHHDVERFTHTFVIYGGGALSSEYQGRLFGVEPLQGRVVMSELNREGSTFRTRDAGYAVTSSDPWFKPVDIKHGPDGALYIADWYDFQVNHWRNYQGNMDSARGRVYRLSARRGESLGVDDLGRASSTRLMELLSSPNRWVRRIALRLLGDRKDAAVRPLLARQLETEKGTAALEILWALHLCGGFDAAAAADALRHPHPGVREWAVRLLGDQPPIPEALFGHMTALARDESHPAVRLQLAATARRLPSGQAIPLIRRLLDRSEDAADARQPLMVWWALEAHAMAREAVLGLFGEAAVWERPMVHQHLLERLMRRYAMAGAPEDLEMCTELLQRAPSGVAVGRLVAGFEQAFHQQGLAGLPQYLVAALSRAGGGSLALQLRMRRQGAVDRALALVTDEAAPLAERLRVIQTLGELKERCAVEPLMEASESAQEPVRVAALAALRVFDDARIGQRALRLAELSEGTTRTAALMLLASRGGWSAQLIRAIEGGGLEADDVSPELVHQLRLRPEPGIKEAVQRLWPGSDGALPGRLNGRIQDLARVIRGGAGDPYKGKELYTANCGSCHKLFNAGGAIGPDLTPFRRDDLEGMLLSILNPSAEIREGYENYQVETRDDRSLSGFIIRRDDRLVVIRGLDGQDVVLSRGEIADLRASALSLMPEGLLDGFEEQPLRDLFAYLRSSQPLAN
jgi:putative heme-binding domain-containing protein